MYIISVQIRGYSVRINQKHRNEKQYRELNIKYGKGKEQPELVNLYKIHLEKYVENCINKQIIVGLTKKIVNDYVIDF